MTSLLGLLDLGATALQAQNAGVAVASNNVANASTDGYSRQRVELESMPSGALVGGVRVGSVERLSSELLSARIRSNGSSVSVADAFASALLDLEAAMSSGGDLGQLVAGFFAGMSQVSAAPSDVNLRDAAVQAARALAHGVQKRAASVQQARAEANQRIREQLQEANRAVQAIARANATAATARDPAVLDLRDRAAARLAELVGGTARIDPDGQMRVNLPGGETLVDGTRAASFATSPDPALGGMDRIEVVDGGHRRAVTGLIDGGRVGGELRMRDQAAPAALARLDGLAYDMSTQVNAVHRQHADLSGQTGGDLFAPPPGVDGAAAAMAVNPDVVADSSLLATGATGAGPGDNAGARALVALRDQSLADQGRRTFVDAGIDVSAALGRSAAEVLGDRDFFTAQGQHLAGLRDSMSGVSLQEEMSNLSQFQHATEAQVKFLSTVDELLDTVIQGL
jgi:flagellar hook-associated protein 1 FlgK